MATFHTSQVPLSASLLSPINLMAAGSAVRILPQSFIREDDDVYVAGSMKIPSSSTPAIVGHGVAKVDKSIFPWWVCRAQMQASAAVNTNYYGHRDIELDPDDDDYIYLAGYEERTGTGYYNSKYYKASKDTLSGAWSWSLSSYTIYFTQGNTIFPSAGTGKVWVQGISSYRTDLSVLDSSTGLTADYVCGGIANGIDDHLSYSTNAVGIIDGMWWLMCSNGGNKVVDIHYVSDGQSAINYYEYSPAKHYSYDSQLLNLDSTYIIVNQGQGINGSPAYAGGPVKLQKTNPYTEAWCSNFLYVANVHSIFNHACLTSASDYVISSGYLNAAPATGVIVKVATSNGASSWSVMIPPASYISDYIYGGHAECIGVCGSEYILMTLPHLVDVNGHMELRSLANGGIVYTTRYDEIDNGVYGSGGWFKNGAIEFDTQDYLFGSMSIKASSHPDMNGAVATAYNQNYGISGTSFTIDFWIKFPTGSDRYSLITSWADDDLKGYEIYYDRLGTGAFSFIYYNSGLADWVEVESNDAALETDVWHHVAITRSAVISAMYFFVDGTSIGVNGATTSHPSTYANYSITDPAPGCPMKIAVRMSDVGEPDYYHLNAYRLRLNTCTWSADFTVPTNYDAYDPDTSHILLLGDTSELAMHYSTDQTNWKQLNPSGLWTYADGQATEGEKITSLKLTDTSSYGKYHESPLEQDGLSGQYNEVDFCIIPTTAATAGQYWFRFSERYTPIELGAGETYPSLYYIPPTGGETEEPTGAYVLKIMRHMKWFSSDGQYSGFWLGGR